MLKEIVASFKSVLGIQWKKEIVEESDVIRKTYIYARVRDRSSS